MPLKLEQVEHIAELARLSLSEAEKELYREQLSAILDYVARLQDLDTSQVEPTSSVLPQRTLLRDDEETHPLPTDELLRNAPLVEQNQFRIPAVFE